MKSPRPHAKLPEEFIELINALYQSGLSFKQISDKLGNGATIDDIHRVIYVGQDKKLYGTVRGRHLGKIRENKVFSLFDDEQLAKIDQVKKMLGK